MNSAPDMANRLKPCYASLSSAGFPYQPSVSTDWFFHPIHFLTFISMSFLYGTINTQLFSICEAGHAVACPYGIGIA